MVLGDSEPHKSLFRGRDEENLVEKKIFFLSPNLYSFFLTWEGD